MKGAKTMTNQTNSNEPIARLKDGYLQVAIWRNTSEQGRNFYSVSKLKRTYKEDGNYKETDSLSGTQLLQAARLLELAYTRIRELEEADYQAGRSSGDEE
jgi:hypothetical protein